MFNEVQKTDEISLVFAKSLNVQVFPCGRRRSELITNDDLNGNGQVTEDEYYSLPFDPEAKLNTEANNRKHSSLNGFSQTYINKWDTDTLSMVIGGYFFNIKQELGLNVQDFTMDNTLQAFGESVEGKIGANSKEALAIYANIRIEEVPLYSGFTSYTTGVLRDQTENPLASTTIDLINTEATNKPSLLRQNPQDYFYFSGLSFSVEPIANSEKKTSAAIEELVFDENTGNLYQRKVSLRILDKINGVWQIHQPAFLPKVEHGDTVDSVKLGSVSADFIYADDIRHAGGAIPALAIHKIKNESNDIVYQLRFSKVDEVDSTS